MTAVGTGWVDGTGQSVNAAYLNNLGSEVDGKYVKPVGGVPSTDLSAAVQATLTTADAVAAAQGTIVNPQIDNYTLVLSDANKAIEVNKATAVNVVIPPNSAVPFPLCYIEVVQMGTGQVTLVAGTGVTLQYPASLLTRVQFSSLLLRKRGTDTWIVSGDAQ